MTTKQGIRRAGARWREGAPDYVVDCFDHGDEYVDRYTVIVLPVEHGEVTYLSTSESGHFSGWASFPIHKCREYRYNFRHRRIRWADLPLRVRVMVTADMDCYNEPKLIVGGN